MAEFLKIYLIAGEASGDLLGAHLMRSLKAQSDKPITFFGIGGEKMAAEGLVSLFPYHELSMMGFVEILPYLYKLAMRINQAADDVRAKAPDALITIDSPGFCFRVVKKLRQHKLKTHFIHYVAPTVWAYKPERAEKCARLFDRMLVLLPFEPPYFEKVGLNCTWVGHPAIAEMPAGDGARFRATHQIPANLPLFCLLPGSRKGEIKRHMPIFRQAIALLATQFPQMAISMAVPKNILPHAMPFFAGCPFPVIIAGEHEKKDAMAASHFAIVKSGTVALEAAQAGATMLVAYRVNALSAWAFRRMALTKYANLVNILLRREAIPELLQENCTAPLIATAAAQLLANPQRLQRQRADAKTALAGLVPAGGPPPSDRAASIVLETIATPPVKR